MFLPTLIFLNKNKIFITLSIIYLILNLIDLNYIIDSLYVLLINQLLNLNTNIFIYVIFFYYCININSIGLYIYILILYLVLHNLNDFNTVNFILNENLYTLNLNLLNGLFIIHPIFIYLFITNYAVIVLKFNSLMYNYLYIINLNALNFFFNFLSRILNYVYLSLYFIAIAIILGSW